MSRIPDFEGLAMFAKVAEERSFAAAARAMGISVATVSRGVTRLEERLGARLFNRTSRQLALTDFGLTLAERATRIYCEAEDVENAARELSSRPRGLIRLAVPMSFGLRWIAPILPPFFRLYPEVAIDLHLSDAVVDLVGDGFDAALRIAVLPIPRSSPGNFVRSRPLSWRRRPISLSTATRPILANSTVITASATPTVRVRTSGASATRRGRKRP